jgi:hypothetical protein
VLRTVVAFLSIALSPLVGSAASTTYVASLDVAAGSTSAAPHACEPPSGVVGGGFDTNADQVLVGEASRPVLGDDAWESAMYNPGAALESFTTAVLCADDAPAREAVTQEFPIPANAVTSHFALCSNGLTASSGGVAVAALPGRHSTVLLAPAWPFDPDGERLRDRAAGRAPGPTAWEAVERSHGGDVASIGIVTVLCADWPGIRTVIEEDAVDPVAVASMTVLCPARHVAVGGGVDADDRQGLYLVASAPVFAGAPLVTRIVDVIGSAADPIGWRVAVRNDAAAPRSLKAAAVCVPEADGAIVTAAMLAAWAHVRSRARGRRPKRGAA